jgi:hypothetical protein
MAKWKIVEQARRVGDTIVPHTLFRGYEEIGRDLSYSEAQKRVAQTCLNNDRIVYEHIGEASVTQTGRQLHESLEKGRGFDEGC